MKVLFTAFKYDPIATKSNSTASYHFYNAIKEKNHNVKIIGPYDEPLHFIERVLNKVYKSSNNWNYIKYKWTNTIKACRELNDIDKKWRPDIIFSLTPSPFAFYKGNTPIILRTDTTFLGMYQQAKKFLKHDPIMLKQMVWLEKKAFSKCKIVITHSRWSRGVLMKSYGVNPNKISYFPNPAPINSTTNKKVISRKRNDHGKTIKLLTVGRDFNRKGIDIAIKVVNQLNDIGVSSKLMIVGLNGKNGIHHKFFGEYNKANRSQFKTYKNFFMDSHLLLHPARFDASPIVTSEASTFGLPTITNDSGGLATSVKHNVSGIIVPKNSCYNIYVSEIKRLFQNPEKYYSLCQTTRKRYEQCLNWKVAGKKLESIFNYALNNK